MPRQPDAKLEYLEFTDFSPGIFSNNKLAGGVQVTSNNPAMAQETNTYRCLPLPTGGLGPAPRRKAEYSLTTLPNPSTGRIYYVAGLGTWGRILPSPSSTFGVEELEVHVCLYHQVVNGANFDLHLNWLRERLFDTNRGTETITNKTVTNVATNSPRFAQFLKTRMNPTTPASPGVPVMVLVATIGGGNVAIISRAWPNPATPTTTSTVVVGRAAETAPYITAVAHQGRVVLSQFQDYGHGATANIITDENFLWTTVNSNTLTTLNGLVFDVPAQLVPEIDASVADLAAMSANQLLVIKQMGGGYVVQGDMDDPTVVQLPNLACPGNSASVRGINTPQGYVYSAGLDGMYKWNGGDQAEHISPQLEGSFATSNGFGQCERFFDLVMAPSNWVWHMASQSWWRIEDPADVLIQYWSTSVNNRIVGSPSSFTDATAAAAKFMKVYERNSLAYSYSWQSHPIWITRDQYIQTRAGVIALQGRGTVTVTLINELGEKERSIMEVDSDVIRNYRFNTDMSSESLQVRIESVGEGGVAEAPLVHRLFLGYHAAQHLPVNG